MGSTDIAAKFKSIGQSSVLRFVNQLDAADRKSLLNQLAAQDLDNLAKLADAYVKRKPAAALPKDIQPVQAYPREPDESRRGLYEQAKNTGKELLSAGKVAAFLVAGGQGTRLGYNGPKGEFPITPIKNKPLFQVFAEQLLGHSRDFGKTIPWYIMTSDINDGPTRAYFDRNKHFGYDPKDVFFFQQGMMPAFSLDGQLLLAEKNSLALSPDGHGGSLRALHRSGALADMRKRGIEHLSYFQVDNPLVQCIDPLFLGLHAVTGSEMSSKTIPKANALEKVGNFVMADGVVQVIEYSDLPEALALSKNSDGSLKFNLGSIAIHALSVAFIERLNSGGQLTLPWHRAEKKVEYVNEAGETIKPAKPNAVKLEQFVFDAIPLAKNAIVYMTDRAEEFSPVKNAEGVDSPESCRRDQFRRASRWLAAAGYAVPADGTVEISPLYANSAEELKKKPLPGKKMVAGGSLYLGE